MINKTLMTTSLAALLLGAGAMAQAQTALKIGVVNTRQLMQDSPQARTMLRALEDEFAGKQRALQAEQKEFEAQAEKFKRDAAVMSEADRAKTERDLTAKQRDFQRRAQDFEQDVQQRQQEEQQRMSAALLTEVQTFAKAQNYDLILSDGVLYAKDAVNVTPAILAALESKAKPGTPAAGPKPAPAAAPAK